MYHERGWSGVYFLISRVLVLALAAYEAYRAKEMTTRVKTLLLLTLLSPELALVVYFWPGLKKAMQNKTSPRSRQIDVTGQAKATRLCRECERVVRDNARVCPYCGARL
jgi:apolipoprotein N-acyltransferase